MGAKTGHNPLEAEARERRLERAMKAYDGGEIGVWQAAKAFGVDHTVLLDRIAAAHAAGKISRAPPATSKRCQTATVASAHALVKKHC